MKNGRIIANQVLSRSFQLLLVVAILFCFIGVSEAGQEKLDPIAVEQTLKAWFTKYPFVKMIGVNQISETSATAYCVVSQRSKQYGVSANIQYLIDKGWFIIRVDLTNGNASWTDVFQKIERKE